MRIEEREEIIEELKKEYPILDQVSFNEFNVVEKLEENMKWRIKYQELYEHHLFIYKKIEEKYDELKGRRYDYWKFESDRRLQKSEIEDYYLPQDKKLMEFREILEKQKIKVDFFKLCMESMEKVYWRIRAWRSE